LFGATASARRRLKARSNDPVDGTGEDVGRFQENVSVTPSAGPDHPDDTVYIEHLLRRRARHTAGVRHASFGWRRGRQLDVLGVLGRLILTGSAAAIVALVVTGRFPPLWNTSGGSGAATSLPLPLRGGTSASVEGSQRAAPRLAITQGVASRAEEDLPIGVSVLGASDGAVLVVTGLPIGSELSSGHPVGANGWRISAADLNNAVVHLPRGFVGALDLSIELRLPDETVAERRTIRLERAPGAVDTETVEAQAAEARTQSGALLDLLRIDDATRVQQRLVELGFLSSSADGVWGHRSRGALRGFRVANRLGSDDTWDEQTQRELFATSANSASAANQPATEWIVETTIPPPPGAMRNPLNRSDALWIQKRLHDLGYYFGNGDAVWGADSRSALRDFKTMNGLADNDTWDKETEQRLSSDIDTGRIFIGRWGVDIVQCQEVQDGSAPITIDSHRAETVGGACSFRSVKRETTDSWRIQALCSADTDSWTANIRLKLRGSKLSWSSERGTTTYIRCPKADVRPARVRQSRR
jgi:hypothetical protein